MSQRASSLGSAASQLPAIGSQRIHVCGPQQHTVATVVCLTISCSSVLLQTDRVAVSAAPQATSPVRPTPTSLVVTSGGQGGNGSHQEGYVTWPASSGWSPQQFMVVPPQMLSCAATMGVWDAKHMAQVGNIAPISSSPVVTYAQPTHGPCPASSHRTCGQVSSIRYREYSGGGLRGEPPYAAGCCAPAWDAC